jgi:hypothetical protein
LDHIGILFPWQASQGSKRKAKAKDDDDLDCDMIDETGESEVKRAKREAARYNRAETLDSLNCKWTETCQQLQKMKAKLVQIGVTNVDSKLNDSATTDSDDLDSYMSSLHSHETTASQLSKKIEKSKLKMQILQLSKEQTRLERLIKIARPSFKLPDLPKMNISTKAKDLLAKAQQKLQTQITNESQSSHDIATVSDMQTVNLESKSKQQKQSEIDLNDAPEPQSNVKPIQQSTKINLKPVSITTIEKPTEFMVRPSESSTLQRKGGLNLRNSSVNPNKIKSKCEARIVPASSQTYLDDSAYVEWIPPTNQAGDGKTLLNKKFGY